MSRNQISAVKYPNIFRFQIVISVIFGKVLIISYHSCEKEKRLRHDFALRFSRKPFRMKIISKAAFQELCKNELKTLKMRVGVQK